MNPLRTTLINHHQLSSISIVKKHTVCYCGGRWINHDFFLFFRNPISNQMLSFFERTKERTTTNWLVHIVNNSRERRQWYFPIGTKMIQMSTQSLHKSKKAVFVEGLQAGFSSNGTFEMVQLKALRRNISWNWSSSQQHSSRGGGVAFP